MLVTGGLQKRLVLVGKFDENVLEARRERTNLGNVDSFFSQLIAKNIQIKVFFHQRVDRLAKNRGAANPGNVPGQPQGARHFGRDDFDAHRAVRLHVWKRAKRVGRAVGNELAVVNVRDVATTLRFVHVVRSYKKSDPVARQLEKQIPKLPASDGVDAGSGLVEKKELGLMQHGAAQGEALLPPARKLGRESL